MDDPTTVSAESLRLGEATSGIGTFQLDLSTRTWTWSPQVAVLFGIPEKGATDPSFASWERSIFPDDLVKINGAFDEARHKGSYYVEFRVKHSDGSVHWLASKGQRAASSAAVHGALYEISERKALEARLLALNETLEGRVAQLREEARVLEVLNATGRAISAELDLERMVQAVTDAAVELSHAEFGAFFYNVTNEAGESYTLYTLSGAPREAFYNFPMPRNTAIFEPTFRGRGPVRSDDILKDPRYGKNEPYFGMPKGHLPVRSYLAIPVVSRSTEVLGGLFLGHSKTHVFTERAERLVTALAAQAAVAIDNVRLYQKSQRAEQELQALNEQLEQRAEERATQLALSQSQLAQTEQRFRFLVEGVTDYAIFMLDAQGHIVNWNPGAARIKGYDREQIIGRHFSNFYTDEDRTAKVPWKALEIARETGKYEAEGWRVRKDGSRFWASVVINALKHADGHVVGFAKITRDLTERRAAEERSRQAQKMEAIGQLTGGVAHDFNNLLTIIVGNLETVQRQAGEPSGDLARIRRAADNAMRGARRAEALTHRLLAFSRQQPLDPKAVDIGRLVSGMSDLLRRTLGENVTVETVLGGGAWRALVDPNQLELAILNLAVNARDAMPDGGKLTLETANVYLDENYAAAQSEVVPGQYAMIAVSDTGEGMTPEVIARAFDPFFTTKGIGHGTGLGLSQVYGFVKQSRGHVKIYSEVGEGTTIKIYLPRAHDAARGNDDIEEGAPTPGAAETILVVEDDPDVRTYGCDCLRELGYNVLDAETAAAGLQILERNSDVRVLFTDIGLPGGVNGRQLAERAVKLRPHLKVLFTTGYARNAIVHGGRLDPGVELLTKPFTKAALATKLRDIIDAKRTPGRVLVVEDEALIRMLAVDYLQDAGFKVDTAVSAADAMNKLALVPGGADAVVIDIGLPDRRGDVLVHDIRSLYPLLPIVVATGHGAGALQKTLSGVSGLEFVEKPYSPRDLLEALRRVRSFA
jgi:PAS domain S-box-containing protein